MEDRCDLVMVRLLINLRWKVEKVLKEVKGIFVNRAHSNANGTFLWSLYATGGVFLSSTIHNHSFRDIEEKADGCAWYLEIILFVAAFVGVDAVKLFLVERVQDIVLFDWRMHISGSQTPIVARYLNAAVDGISIVALW